VRFALDQNFPLQATGLAWPRGSEVIPLTAVDPDLTRNHEDWEIFRALDQRGDVDGFVTNDAAILLLAREMVMLARSRLTLVVTDGLDHDPLGATGLLILHLPQIDRQNHPTPRKDLLRWPALQLLKVRPIIDGLAARERIPAPDLVRRESAAIDRLR
jgi:hypothetical protein